MKFRVQLTLVFVLTSLAIISPSVAAASPSTAFSLEHPNARSDTRSSVTYGDPVVITDPADPSMEIYPTGVNDSGIVSGDLAPRVVANGGNPVVWRATTTGSKTKIMVTHLKSPSGEDAPQVTMSTYGITDAGSVYGATWGLTDGWHGLRWTATGAATDLGFGFVGATSPGGAIGGVAAVGVGQQNGLEKYDCGIFSDASGSGVGTIVPARATESLCSIDGHSPYWFANLAALVSVLGVNDNGVAVLANSDGGFSTTLGRKLSNYCQPGDNFQTGIASYARGTIISNADLVIGSQCSISPDAAGAVWNAATGAITPLKGGSDVQPMVITPSGEIFGTVGGLPSMWPTYQSNPIGFFSLGSGQPAFVSCNGAYLVTDGQVVNGQRNAVIYKAQCPAQSHAAAVGAVSTTVSRDSGEPCADVVVQPTRSGVMKSGLSWPASPPPVGFATNEPDGDFLQKCLSGCRNVLVYVRAAGGGSGIPNAQVKVSVAPLTGPDVINPSQGGGYLCEVAFILSNRDGSCGNPLTVTTDSAGGDEGKVYLRYFPPAVYVPEDKSSPTATITAETTSCSSSCSIAKGHADISVGPHLIYQRLGVGLTWGEKQALIEWDRHGSITKNVKPIDKTLSTLSKLLDTSKKLKNLSKAVGDLAKGVSLYGTMSDYAMLDWFQQRFGVANDGLVHLGSTDTIVNEILKYVKNPIANAIIGPLKGALFKSSTYPDLMINMLRDYANSWLWTDETNRDAQVMNLKLFEASYCRDSTCRSLAPGFGIHYNLYAAFSSKDFTQTTPYFKAFNVETGYAAPTWIPSQCGQMSRADQLVGQLS